MSRGTTMALAARPEDARAGSAERERDPREERLWRLLQIADAAYRAYPCPFALVRRQVAASAWQRAFLGWAGEVP